MVIEFGNFSIVSDRFVKTIREVLIVVIVIFISDCLDKVLEKYDFRRVLRVIIWVIRFINNCKIFKGRRFLGFLIIVEVGRVK